MCAGKYQIFLLSIAVAVISDASLSAKDAVTAGGAAAQTETDSIPTANSPLPQITAVASQKPTSAAPAKCSAIATDWTITRENGVHGERKPALLNGIPVSEPSQTQPILTITLVSPPAQNPQLKAIASEPVVHGSRKPALPSAPPASEITRVQWSAESRSADSRKTIPAGFGFRADCVPFVLWNPNAPGEFCPDEMIDRAPIGSCSDLAATYGVDTAGRVFLASLTPEATGGVDPADVEALRQLQPLADVAGFSGDNYLTDLNQLLHGESSWIFGNEQLLDLAPNEGNEGSDSYLEDLHSLIQSQAQPVSARPKYRQISASQETSPPALTLPPRKTPGKRYDAIAPEPVCNAVGGHGVSSLFQPMSSIQVTGMSSAPPEKDPKAVAGESTALDRPENVACVFMEDSTPSYYFPPTRYGVCRPSRNTHTLHHNPLYFEDPNLERCGQGHGCLTTAVSAVHFGTAIAFTPYLTAATCPSSCVRALPDCPTCHSFGHDAYCPGWSWKGAAAQAAAVTGLYFIIP